MASSIGQPIDARATARGGGPAGARPEAASQTLTFLFTDVEGSTRLWEQFPTAMKQALERHDAILTGAIRGSNGQVVKATGDGMMAVFRSAIGALNASIAAQHALVDEPWPETGPLRVRMALHSGEADRRAGDYFGPVVNRTARIMAAGHGGQVLLSATAAALVVDQLPDRASLADLGEHRLKDLERPERLFQLVHLDLTTEFPALATLNRRPTNLPTQTSAFVGRDAELAEIRRRIEDDAVRLLTLTGPGGTGKTRLALRAAADQVDRFEDGVFFVDLASVSDTDSVLALVARAMGINETRERSPLDEIKLQLRGQRVLLVLDNFEQVTVAATTLADVLQDCPELKVLVTSREALRVRGEHLFAVPPLSLPRAASAARSAEDLSRFEAIQLFVERARAVRPDFHLTDDNAAAVADICLRLDGLPLAIELATARINLFSPEALRDRLGSRLKALGSGARDLPARQQTLRATIEWSYQLLEPGEQRLLELLSVFSSATFDAVEAVGEGLQQLVESGLDTVDGLTSLLAKSLVRQAEEETGEPRLVMLETIREYAAERLDARPEFSAAARSRHGEYFADFASHEWAQVSAATRDSPLEALTADLENLRIAWRHWAAQRDLERLNQLVDGLWHIYEVRGWYHATIELMTDLLDVLSSAPASPERWQQEVTLRTSLARALMAIKGYTEEVEDAYARAVALFEGQRELPQLFPVLRGMASFYQYRADFDKGIEIGTEILQLAEAQDDPSMRVDGNLVLGSSLAFAGDLPRGLKQLDEAIGLFESQGYRPRRLRLGVDPRVSCLTTAGFVLWLSGYPDRAVARADRGIALATELDHPFSLAYVLFHSGFLHLWRLEPRLVEDRALRLLRVVDAHDFPIWRALGTVLLGAATSALGKPEEGLERIAAGLELYQGLRTPPVFWPLIRFVQAGAYVQSDRPQEAVAMIDEALEIGGPERILSPVFLVVRGDLLLRLPDPEAQAAEVSFQDAYDLAARLGARTPQLRAAVRLYRLAGDRVDAKERADVLRAVYETFTEGFETADVIEARDLLADAPS